MRVRSAFHPVSPMLPLVYMVILSGCSGCAEPPGTTEPADPGFTEAYFDKDQLTELSKDGLAFYYHFYNVLPSGAETGSVTAMGAKKDHDEVYSYLAGPWYRCYEALTATGTRCDKLTADGARGQVDNVRRAGLTPYAAVFNATDVLALFEITGCNGVRLTPARTEDDRYWTMTLTPVKIEDGEATVVGGVGDVRISTNPCPTYCGMRPTEFLNCR